MKLAAKLILIFLVGVLGIVSLFAWQTIQRQHDWEAARRASHANDLAATLAPTIEQAYREGGTITIQQAIEVSTRRLHGPEVRWIDKEATSPHTQVAGTVSHETTSRQTSSVLITDPSGNRKMYSYVPMTLGDHQSGAVEISEPLADQDAFTRQAVTTSLLSLLGVASLSGLVVYFGGVQLVGKPLGRLITQVNAIGEGQLDQPPALQSNDELGRLAVAISDMSHRLSQQRDTIRHADRLGTLGTLAAGMAHELGTPLNVVSGRAGLIQSGRLTPEEITASAETIRSEAERMTKIIRQLLDFSRQTPSPHEPTSLDEIVQRTCDMMRPLADQSHVEIQTEFAERPIHISGDAAQLQQVLTNLVTNAIAAMPNGGTVTVGLSEQQHQVRLSVADTGVGIAPDAAPHVFEPFYTTKDVGQGTGLGLSIAYGIVKEHSGEIVLDSEPGHGSTFTITFPAAVDAAGEKAHTP